MKEGLEKMADNGSNAAVLAQPAPKEASLGSGKKSVAPKAEQKGKKEATADSAESDSGESAAGSFTDHPIYKLTVSYLESLRSVAQTIGIVMPHLAKWLLKDIESCQKNMAKFRPSDGSGKLAVFTHPSEMMKFSKEMQRFDRLSTDKSLSILARSLFVQAFCEMDAFMGSLLKVIYREKGDLMRGISREITLADLMNYPDIDSVRRAMLDKEVETFRRDGYVDQFDALERKFGVKLKQFPEWSEFVEFAQRRNILVHNDGVVSDQYLAACKKEGVRIADEVGVGFQHGIAPPDLKRLILVMSKIGVMLAHTLWSKLFPEQSEQMHESMNDILYSLLDDERWSLAAELGQFALSKPMISGVSDLTFRIRVVNVAIGRKFSGDEKGAQAALDGLDWTACLSDFRLAVAVLKDEFAGAISIMKSIGKRGQLVNQDVYHIWPLFEKFRLREDFYQTYEEIYGESYKQESHELKVEMKSENSRKGNKRDSSAKAKAPLKAQRGKTGEAVKASKPERRDVGSTRRRTRSAEPSTAG